MSDDLAWLPGSVDDPLLDAVHRVVEAVMRLGGAVGWVDVPDRAETAGWLAGIAAESPPAGPDGAALRDGRVEALGRWTGTPSRPSRSTGGAAGDGAPDARGRRAGGWSPRWSTTPGAAGGDAHLDVAATTTPPWPCTSRSASRCTAGCRTSSPSVTSAGTVLYRLDLRTADWPLRRHGGRPIGAGASSSFTETPGGSMADRRPPI